MITLNGNVAKFRADGETTKFKHNLKHTDFLVYVNNDFQKNGFTKTELSINFDLAPDSDSIIELKRSVELIPQKYEKYQVNYGNATETRNDGQIVTNWDHRRGANFWYFLMAWDMADDEEVEPLWEMLKYSPIPADPMKLTWTDGTQYSVIFADRAGENKCKFEESIIDDWTGKRKWQGTVALIEIEKL